MVSRHFAVHLDAMQVQGEGQHQAMKQQMQQYGVGARRRSLSGAGSGRGRARGRGRGHGAKARKSLDVPASESAIEARGQDRPNAGDGALKNAADADDVSSSSGECTAERFLSARPHLLSDLAGKATSSGYTFAQLIKCGVDAPGCDALGAGVALGDAECFDTFAALLRPLVCRLHGLPAAGSEALPQLRALEGLLPAARSIA